MINGIIEKNLIPSDNFIYGFANLHGLLDKKFDNFCYAISIGKHLNDKIIDRIENGPTIEYFNHYKKTNTELAEISLKIQSDLLKNGIQSKVIIPTIAKEAFDDETFLKNLTAEISHKMVATRAGLGWIGKTDLFISKAFGPRLRLATILLNQNPGIVSSPIEKSRCGNCEICVLKCPANAANGKLWDIHTHRDEFFDAHKCNDKCIELAKHKLGLDERVCGICISFCPIGKKSP